MIVQAAILLLAAAAYVLWPLLRAEAGGSVTEPDLGGPARVRARELEELDLDVATGRVDRQEAGVRRRELER